MQLSKVYDLVQLLVCTVDCLLPGPTHMNISRHVVALTDNTIVIIQTDQTTSGGLDDDPGVIPFQEA